MPFGASRQALVFFGEYFFTSNHSFFLCPTTTILLGTDRSTISAPFMGDLAHFLFIAILFLYLELKH